MDFYVIYIIYTHIYSHNRGQDRKASYMKNQLKINAKTIENLPKNRPKMNQKSVLEGSQGGLGGSWRPRSKKSQKNPNFWRHMDPSWGRLGGLLRPSWRLDRRLGPSWAV